ncbi:uncharacterized protein LOC107636452 [Arachis ipaensis]|uniref:uncharacterized protein LOC107636452 n=1 Tax=Arachis ipaensis TaxID=130454 RepID=UPI0007AF59DC|nr:uncharacterized protein LOC107636452 [Arachis ipaensis]
MGMLQIKKQRKDEARCEALRVANEECKKLKAEAAQISAPERKIAQQEFRETLVQQNRDDNNKKNNSISNKFLLPRKPYFTNKELLRTIAYLKNDTLVFYEARD